MSSISVHQALYRKESTWVWQVIGVGEQIIAALLLVVLSPLFGAIWTTILVLSGYSPLIAHRRVGQHGAVLWVLKFRTMWGDRARRGIRQSLWVEYIDDEAGPAMKTPATFGSRAALPDFAGNILWMSCRNWSMSCEGKCPW